MRAVRLEAVGSLRVSQVPDPHPAAGEVVVRVEACGVCGTDRHLYRGDYSSAKPVTLGHELAGTVVAVGEDVTVESGVQVAVDPNISCGTCRECRRGDVCLCRRRVALGVDLDGGLAEYVVAPARQLYVLPAEVGAEWGALCEPIACCLRALDHTHISAGSSVAVLGGGVIGQLMVQLAVLAGATDVVLVTRQPVRRALAERLGATVTFDPRKVDPVDAITGPAGVAPGGVDVSIECVGSGETFQQAVGLARRGGTVVIVGVAPESEEARISPYDVFARELRIVGSYLNPLTHGRAVDLVASGRLALDPLITRRLSLDDVPAALASPPETGEIKAIVLP